MSNISVERWEDVIPDPDEDGIEAYNRFYDGLHEYEPGEWATYVDTYGVTRNGGRKCKAITYRSDGSERTCNGSSHDSNHLPIDSCCYCKHGVYLHTSYDIPCGRCEMGDYDYEDENAVVCPLESNHNIQDTENGCWSCTAIRMLLIVAEQDDDIGKQAKAYLREM
jgi:hypothetical protein